MIINVNLMNVDSLRCGVKILVLDRNNLERVIPQNLWHVRINVILAASAEILSPANTHF